MAPLPSFRQLQYLVALADELHFGRAAERCRVTQSTLSAGLKELEGIAGASLAERTKRSVIMTPVGQAMAGRARILLHDAEALLALARTDAEGLGGTIRLGAIPTVAPYLLPRLLTVLGEAPGTARLLIREELTPSLLGGVQGGRLDAVLAAVPYDLGDLETEALFPDGYLLACPRGHPLAGEPAVEGAALAGLRLLLLERGHCLHQHALSAFSEVQLREDLDFSATSLATLVAMVAEGIGVTLLPRLAVATGIARGYDVALVPVRGAHARQVVLAWRKTTPRRAAFLALAEALRAAHPQADATGRPPPLEEG